MHFEFEKMDVYQAALEFVAMADEIAEHLPTGRASLKDQLRRAGLSITANIAEGVGELAPKEKARFYRMARRSPVECASHVLVARRLELAEHGPGEAGPTLQLEKFRRSADPRWQAMSLGWSASDFRTPQAS